MLAPIRGQLAEDAGCFPRRSRTPIEGARRPRSVRPSLASPKTSRCHPGCLSPDVQESIEATFCRLLVPQQAVSPSRKAWDSPRGEVDSAPEPGVSQELVKTYVSTLTHKEAPDVQSFTRLPKELKEALKVLGRPRAVWPHHVCKEVRRQAARRCGREEAALLQKVQHCVRLATENSFHRGFYEVEDTDSPGYQKLWLADVLAPSLQVRWFDGFSTQIPVTKVDIGKAVPPPLIVTDVSCLDVAERLRSLDYTREIFVVTELLDFEGERGVALRPHCMTLRSDLQRFVQHAATQLKSKHSLRQMLCDRKMPQAFLASDVCCIRGSQGDGYPFLQRPFRHHVLGMALWTARPRLRTERDSSGERMTMYADSDDAKAYEARLELCAHAALLAAGGVDLPREDQPVLVLPVIGLGGSSFHPQDAIVLALKRLRRRFTQFFHSIYVCCGDRGPNFSLSDFIESAVNRSAYMMAQNDSLAAKALPWHWDQREIQMSVAANRLEPIGHHMRQGPTYVVTVREDRRSAERKQIVQKVEVQPGFGTLRAYKHRKQLEAADELIKAQRRQGDWPADMVHVKLGGLRDNLELAPEFERSDLRRKSLEVKLSLTRIDSQKAEAAEEVSPGSPLARDLGTLQDFMFSARQSSKTRTFNGWLSKADAVTQQIGRGGEVLLHAKRRSRKASASVEAAVASEDVRLET